jgi:hypothetical protein
MEIMALQCNIDAKGKAIRLVNGVVAVGVGALIGSLTWSSGWGGLWWWIAAAMVAGGAFMIFEGWAGWCVLRAMGFKTKV